jgi:uncharacterized membrane protein YphA (DoxX/SURF4 family)
LATFFFHSKLADQAQYLFFLKNVGIVAGLVALMSAGAGRIALDKFTGDARDM